MPICDRRGRWQRTPGSFHWYSDDLPGWCVASTFTPDRRGLYHRTFFAQYRGITVGEVYPTGRPERVMDELDELLGRGYCSPQYVRHFDAIQEA